MTEVRNIIEGKSTTFTGLCSLRELLQLIDSWFKNRGYFKVDTGTFEEVKEDHKNLIMQFEATKEFSDYIKSKIKMRINALNLADVDVEIEGKTQTVQKLEVTLEIDAFIMTDYENRWEMKPFYYFLRTLMDKFVYKGIIHRYQMEIMQDVESVEGEIQAFMNIIRYKTA